MSLLNAKDQQYLTELLAPLAHPVQLIVFTQEFECQFCRETRQIAEEVAALSPHIALAVHDLVADEATAAAYGIDKIPALVVMRGGDRPKDYGIRFYGIPSGYEFSSLIEAIKMVGYGDSGLSQATRDWLATLSRPVDLQVFVTPTCPYCPRAVVLAHQLALESDLVTAAMVEASEFPHLAMRYHVMGVPRTVINETVFLEGAAPEALLLARVQEAVAPVAA